MRRVNIYSTTDGHIDESYIVEEEDPQGQWVRVEDLPTREEAKKMAYDMFGELYQKGVIANKSCYHFGRCEVNVLLDFIYGERDDSEKK